MTAPAAVEADRLELAFGAGPPVLAGVSLALAPGERLAVLGRSGAGKTTLLRLLAGLLAPDAGTIRLGGREASCSGRVLIQSEVCGVGLVFQGLALWPHLSVLETLVFAGQGPRRERRDAARRLAERVGLGARLDALPDQLSGGERQRLALVRALARDPALLLLDEPFAHQDAPLRAELGALLLELSRERGVALLLVTHQAEDACDLAERALVLAKGCALEEGALAALRATPRHEETVALLGLGTVLGGLRAGETARTALGELPLEPGRAAPGEATSAGELRLWLRPDQLQAGSAGVAATVLTCAPRGEGWLLRARLDDGSQVCASASSPLAPGAATALAVRGPARVVL